MLLVVPPFDFSVINSATERSSKQAGYYLYYPPAGLCSIAAVLEGAGFGVEIIDGQVDAGTEGRFIDMIVAARPSIIGIGVTTPALPVVRRVIGAIKSRLDVPIVAGGPHVSCDPEIVAPLGADYGVAGDGEYAMRAIAESLLRGLPLAAGEPGVVVPGADFTGGPALVDLHSLPFPARHKLKNPDAYFNPFVGSRTTTLLTARGCPFHCSFCSRNASMGAYRPLEPGRALEEMELVDSEGYGFVSILDETFTFERDRVMELAREMTKRDIKFLWSCQTRADLVDEELMRTLRAAGCINISFGVEAGDPDVRDSLDKRINDDAYDRAFRACRAAGVSINAFVIIGSPDETRAQVERSIERVIELEPDYAVYNVGTLFPGTKEYDARVERGECERGIWNAYMRGGEPLRVLSRTMGRAELAALLRHGYTRFYMRPAYMLRRLLRIRSLLDISVLFRQARTVISDYVVS